MRPNLFSTQGKKDVSVKLFCFSPPVILATFIIETSLAAYAWWRYRSTRVGRVSAVLLILLATFQVSELFICHGGSNLVWSRVGFVAIAFLPVLGLDLIAMLAHQKWPVWIGYAVAVVFSAFFVFLPSAFTGAACTGKFVAFQGGSVLLDFLYGIYYIPTTVLGILLIVFALRHKSPNRRALAWLLVGYLAFCLPVFILYILVLSSSHAVASVLCGFAVLLALTIALKVLPAVEKS